MIRLLFCFFTVMTICLGVLSWGRLLSPGDGRPLPALVSAQTSLVPADEEHAEALRRVQQELETTQTALRTLQQEVYVAQQEGTAVRQQLQAAQAELHQWQERYAALEETRTSLRAQLQQASAAEAEARQRLQKGESELLALRAQIQQTAAAEVDVRQRLQKVDGELATLRAQLQDAQKIQGTQSDELVRLRQTLSNEHHTLTQLRHELATSHNTLSALRQRLQSTEMKHEEKAVQLRAFGEQLRHHLALAGHERMVTTQIHNDHVRLQVPHDTVFLSRGATMRRETQTFLNMLATFLKERPPYTLQVEGHTDAVPIRASSRQKWPTNWELSGARAAVIVRYLERKGLPPERLALSGYGASRPVTMHPTSAGQAQNRRLELILRPLATP